MKRKLVNLALVLVLAIAMVGIMPGVAAANDGNSGYYLTAHTPIGAFVGKLFVLTDGVLNLFVNTDYDGSSGVFTIGSFTGEGRGLVEGLATLFANTAKIFGDIARMLAGTPVG